MKIHKQAGFTLIEMIITVAIIGILAAVAFPLYQNQVQKTRRTTAMSDLLEVSQWMERSYSNSFDYTDAGAIPAHFAQSPRNGTAFYNISFAGTVTRNSFTLQAVPIGGQASDACGTLKIDEQGTRSADETDCW